MKDVESLKKFRSTLDSSDYAASLVDKAISAYKNKANTSSNAADQFSDPFEELVRLSKENNAREGEEEDDNEEFLIVHPDLIDIDIDHRVNVNISVASKSNDNKSLYMGNPHQHPGLCWIYAL